MSYNPTIANPANYATYTDALSLLPSLANLVTIEGVFVGEGLYNFVSNFMVQPQLPKSRWARLNPCPLGVLSLYLTLHYFTLSIRTTLNPLFDPNDAEATSGSINEILAEDFKVRYSEDKVANSLQSSYFQTDYGRTYWSILYLSLIHISEPTRPY